MKTLNTIALLASAWLVLIGTFDLLLALWLTYGCLIGLRLIWRKP